MSDTLNAVFDTAEPPAGPLPLYVRAIANGVAECGLRWWLHQDGDATPTLSVSGHLDGAYVSASCAMPGATPAAVRAFVEGVADEARQTVNAKLARMAARNAA